MRIAKNVAMHWLFIACIAVVGLAKAGGPEPVTFRDDHTVLVGGRPFFPLGLYYTQETFEDASGARAAEIQQFGFNTVGCYGSNDEMLKTLQAAGRFGLKAWARGSDGLAVASDKAAATLESQVQMLRGEPALLFWEFTDEPLLNKVDLAHARRGQEIVKRLDPAHPLLVVEWPGAAARFSEWRGMGDIYGTDLYPIPRERGYGALANKDITQMRDYLGAIRAARGDGPKMLVLQAWSWEPLRYGKTGYPTVTESRFMAYQSVIHGANGLFYYGQLHCTRPNSASSLTGTAADAGQRAAEFQKCLELNRGFWSEHREFFRQLGDATRVFVLRDAPTEERAATDGKSPTIEIRTKTSQDGVYVLAANASDKPHECTLHVPRQDSAAAMHVRFENRKLPMKAGKFTDAFKPYEVHVYSTADRLP